MILVGSKRVWLPTYAFAYFSLHFVLFVCVGFKKKFFAYALFPSAQVGEAKCVPGVVFFVCFRVVHVILDLPAEAYATCSPRLRWGEM